MQIKLSEAANGRGLRHAFLTLDEEKAKALISKKKIGNGWNRWKVKELENLPKCYKCHRVGQIANKCNKKNTRTYATNAVQTITSKMIV